MKINDIVFLNRTPKQLPRTTNIIKKFARIVEIGYDKIGLEFDFLIDNGHDCHGNGRLGYCWYAEPGCLKSAEMIVHFNHSYQ